jgi:hypothetical protein
MEGTDTCRRVPALSFEATTRAISEDRQGRLWFGTEQGLYRYTGGTVRRFTTDDGLPSDWVQGILEARDGALWFATNGGGIARYRDGGFTALTTAEGLAGDAIRALYEDADGVLWVGSEGGGLTRIAFVPGTAEVADLRIIREAHGLFDSWLHLLLEDDDGRLWMSSNRGIFWVWKRDLDALARGERDRVHSVVHTEQDGLRSAAGNGRIQPAGLKANDGRLWFPTENGLAVIDPASLGRFTTEPTALIERIEVWGEDQPIQHGRVSLAADQRMLTLDYTALDWPDGDRVRFQYRLEGHEDEWVDAGQRRQVVYSGLGPGRYTFRVRAMNQAGVWSPREATLAVTVASFYYEQAWFWLLVGALGLTVMGGRIGGGCAPTSPVSGTWHRWWPSGRPRWPGRPQNCGRSTRPRTGYSRTSATNSARRSPSRWDRSKTSRPNATAPSPPPPNDRSTSPCSTTGASSAWSTSCSTSPSLKPRPSRSTSARST